MRSAASTTVGHGRHRWGRPGLVHVSTFVAVVYRGLLTAWRIPGRHRHVGSHRAVAPRLPQPAHAI